MLRAQLELHVTQWKLGRGPQPVYTCPACRVEVKSKPAEDFKLKAIVRTVAGATGETSPTKKGPVRGGVGDGPWDGYFGKGLGL